MENKLIFNYIVKEEIMKFIKNEEEFLNFFSSI